MNSNVQEAYAAIRHYLELGRYEQVLEIATEALSLDPEDAYLHFVRAACYYRLELYKEAEEALDEAGRYGFDDEGLHVLRGDLYAKTNRLPEAEAEYLAVLRQNPNHAGVHASYGYLMWKAGQTSKAEKLIQEALRLDPEDEQVLRYHHLFQMARKGKDEQLHALERYVQYADNEVAVHVQIGLNELYHGRTKQAKEQFIQAYLLEPTNKLLQEVLESLERDAHPLLAPLHWVNRLGGPAVVWLVGIGLIFTLRALGYNLLAGVFAIVYIMYVVYSWIAVGTIKFLNRRRRG